MSKEGIGRFRSFLKRLNVIGGDSVKMSAVRRWPSSYLWILNVYAC